MSASTDRAPSASQRLPLRPRRATGAVAALALALVLAPLAACGRDGESAPAGSAPVTQTIGPENVAVALTDTLRSGPPISGTLGADREARIRAEVGGAVLETLAEPGERVAAGAVLARIDDATVRDAALSARSGVAQAALAAEQAARELQRAKTLAAAGAIAERDVEGAERAALAAQAQLDEAKSRLASAEKALRATVVRAPFPGVVAERAVSAGDIVAPGAALFTVIDPRSLRVEAAVPTTALADVRVGAPVVFTVTGSDRPLTGRITRVSPMVDPQTRQVRILATVPNAASRLVAGLFVEGRVATERRVGILVPEKAVDQTGIAPYVMRLKDGRVEKVEVVLGLRDEGAERLEVRRGLAAGDTVLLGAARGVSVGTPVVVSAPVDAPPAVPPSALRND
jgi:RND family efflux transporter MFP subunit